MAVNRNWTGATDFDFNTASNWAPAGVPTSADDLTIYLTGDGTITLSASITVGSIDMQVNGVGANGGLDANGFVCTVLGVSTFTAPTGDITTDLTLNAGSTGGGFAFQNDVTFGGASGQAVKIDAAISQGLFAFDADVTFEQTVQAGVNPPSFAFNKSGTTNLVLNNTLPLSVVHFTIGSSNTTTVIASGTGSSTALQLNMGDLTVGTDDQLDMASFMFNQLGSGNLNVNGNGTLKFAGANMPTGYTYNFASGSTVEYNGGIQMILSATYGNLIFSNSGNKNVTAATVVQGDCTVDGTATLELSGGLAIAGSMTINSTAIVNANSQTINVGGNWSATGTFNEGNSTVIFDGAGSQSITVAGGETFYNFTMNVSSVGITLTSALTVNNVLTLTSGDISLGVNDLILSNTATVSGASAASHVNSTGASGKIIKSFPTATSFTYPFGDGTQYSPLLLSATLGTYPGTFDVDMNNSIHGNVSGASATMARNWSVNTAIAGVAYSVNANYINSDVAGSEPSMFGAAWNGSTWEKMTAVNDISDQFSSTVQNGNADFTAFDQSGFCSGNSLGFSPSNISCFGLTDGSAAANLTGGRTPYSYSWDSGAMNQTTQTATGLSAGVMAVTVVDGNGCNNSGTVTITSPSAITATYSYANSPLACFGYANASATANVSGGTTPYTYLWNSAAANQTTATAGSLTAGTYDVTVTDNNSCTHVLGSTVITEPSAVSLTVNNTASQCAGVDNGTGIATFSGGTTPYTYAWVGSQTTATAVGLAAGTYTVTATDANTCILTGNTTITNTFTLSMGMSKTDVNCFGGNDGTATGLPTGGTSPYAYAWNMGATIATAPGLIANTYTLTATDANACPVINAILVPEPADLVLNDPSTDVTCNGGGDGTSAVGGTGGTTPYSYLWATSEVIASVSGRIAGSYAVTVTDANSCQKTMSANVGQPGPIVPNAVAGQPTCNGASDAAINTTASGGNGTPYTYVWSSAETTSGVTGKGAGSYTVTVTDASLCQGSQVATVTDPAVFNVPTPTLNGSPVNCFGDATANVSITPSGGQTAYSYSWSNGATTQVVNNIAIGNYKVTVTDALGCSGISSVVTVTQPTDITILSSFVEPTCQGLSDGSINITVTGGAPSYSFNWSGGLGSAEDPTGAQATSYTVSVTDAAGCMKTGNVVVTEPTVLTATSSTTDPNCFGASNGAIDLIPTGGTTAYSYAWDSGQTIEDITGLTAGSYTCTITDANGCTYVQADFTTNPPVLASTITPTNIACHGASTGAITYNATGGLTNYTYAWTGGSTVQSPTGLTAGTYTVTLTDQLACTHTISVILTEPSALSITSNATNAQCNGGVDGSLNITVTGGTTAYTYLWSNLATTEDLAAVASGGYTVTVTDASSCLITISDFVGQPTPVSVTITPTHVACNGNSTGGASAAVSGGTTGYTYQWSNGPTANAISSVAAGTYVLTTTDANSCINTTSTTITEPAVLNVVISGVNLACNSISTGTANTTVTGGTTAYTYAWSNGATTANISSLPAGMYSVTVTDGGGCVDVSNQITITEPTPLVVSTTITNNPCNGQSVGQVATTASGGAGSYSYLWSNAQNTATATGLAAGSYSLTVTDLNLCTKIVGATITAPANLAATTGSTNVSCNGGSDGTLGVTVTGGGTTPYTYEWNTVPVGTTAAVSNQPIGTYGVTVTDANACDYPYTATITEPSILTMTVNGSDNGCAGGSAGSITVTAGGGNGLYNFTWDNALSPAAGVASQVQSSLSSNTYNVTGTDQNGCTVTGSHVISSPSALSIGETITSVTCNGGTNGSHNVTVTGGTISYSYSWSNGPTVASNGGLSAGNYSLTVTDANGCVATTNSTITEPTSVVATPSVTATLCNGNSNGSASVSGAGGDGGPYTYLWSGAQTTATIGGLSAGSYGVTVSDGNGCAGTAMATVTEPGVIVATTTVTNATCNGYTDGVVGIAVSSGGTTPYTYTWNTVPAGSATTVTGQAAGLYNCSVTDANACLGQFGATVTEPTAISITVVGANNGCSGGTEGAITVTGSGGNPTYAMAWNNSLPAGISLVTQTQTGLADGTYNVTFTDAVGCTNTASYGVTSPTAVTVSAGGTDVSCNGGANGTLNASASGGVGPYSYSWTGGATTASVTGLIAGTYNVTVKDNNLCATIESVTISEPTILTASASSNATKCNGSADGDASVVAGGGAGGYTYSWTGGHTTSLVTGLSAGTYNVTVVDANSCSVSAATTVSEPAVLSASAVNTSVTCSGASTGTLGVSAMGGTSPYGFIWSNGATTGAVANISAGTYAVTATDANGCVATASTTVTEATPITLSAANTPVSCHGGSDGALTPIVGGGTTPYGYNWSNGSTANSLTGLTAGPYAITITDANGCIKTGATTVSEPSAVTITATSSNLSCNGANDGTVGVTAAGGISPYTYAWTGGATTDNVSGLAAGTYTTTVTDVNLCTQTASVTITQPDPLVASAVGSPVLCAGGATGSATASGAGGTTPYGYAWSSGGTSAIETGLVAGTYAVTLSDIQGCASVASVTITEPLALSVTASATPALCNGASDGTAMMTASGGQTGYSYAWSNGSTVSSMVGLSAGTYAGTVTDSNGCQVTTATTVTEPTALTASAAASPVGCAGGATGSVTVTAGGGTTAYSYAWTGGGATDVVGGLTAGTYVVTVTDANSCSIVTSTTVTEPLALTASASNTPVSCNGGNDGTLSVLGGGGTTAYGYLWTGGSTSQTVTGQTAGIYSVTVTDNNLCTAIATTTITEPLALSLTTSSTPVSCNGGTDGSVSSTVSGGVISYTYAWSNGSSSASQAAVAAGTYGLTVTDANTCVITSSVTVTEPMALSVTASSSPALCNGSTDGSAMIVASGGTTAYTYEWNTGASTSAIAGLGAGTYSGTVTDANGCTAVSSTTVTEPTPLTATATSSPVGCAGGATGSVSVTANGGTTSYGYAWTGGGATASVAGLTAGTYMVTVTDANGCSIVKSTTITEPMPLTVTAASSAVSCFAGSDGTTTASVGGGTTPYVYTWTGGGATQVVNSLTAGIYVVTVTDNNLCTATASTTITTPTALTLTTSSTPALCSGSIDGTLSSATSGGTTNYSYAWSNGGSAATQAAVGAGTYVLSVTDANGCVITSSTTVTEPTAVSVTAASTPASCAGMANGTATLAGSGGSSGFSYAWSTGATTSVVSGLLAGTYTGTVTDVNGCSANASTTITEPLALTVNITTSAALCAGSTDGAATVAVTGGTTAYGYAWSNGGSVANITNIGAGTYTVTVTDANGCTIVSSSTVTEPQALSITGSSSDVVCNGEASGSGSVLVTGGTVSYDYLWSTGSTVSSITGVVAGNYGVTSTDANGCSIVTVVTVVEPTTVGVTAAAVDALCNGASDGIVSASATGGVSGFTYAWSTGANTAAVSGLAAGVYSVTASDSNGCSATASTTVSEPSSFLTSVTGTVDVLCNGAATGSGSVAASGGTTPYAYAWSNATGSATATGLTAGIYQVTLSDANGCFGVESVTLTSPTAVSVSPAQVNVSCNGALEGAAAVSVSGGVSGYTFAWSTTNTTESITGLAAGTYDVSITDANACVSVEVFSITEPTAVVASASASAASCNGADDGSASASASGGVSAFNYAWSSGQSTSLITGMIAGVYEVTVTDGNGCERVAVTTVLEPAGLTISTTYNPIACFGDTEGDVITSVSGGITPYSFSWNTGETVVSLTGLTAGLYARTITDGIGCETVDTFNLVEPAVLTMTPVLTNPACAGDLNGTVALDVTGGTTPYSYAWGIGSNADQLSNVGAGFYNVDVIDAHSCSITGVYQLQNNPLITVTSTFEDTICGGELEGFVNTAVSGGVSPYSYAWSNGATTTSLSGLAAGSYSGTVTDAMGCEQVSAYLITATEIIDLSLLTLGVDTYCLGSDSLIIGAGQGFFTYYWNNGATTDHVIPTTSGEYFVTVTNVLGCPGYSDSVSVVVYDTTNSPSIVAGVVEFQGTPITAGVARLIAKPSNNPNSMYTVEEVTINADGSYEFLNVMPGRYTVKAKADTGLYPNAVTTYLDSTNHWQNARYFIVGCQDSSVNNTVYLTEFPTTIGFGSISGTVTSAPGKRAGDPVPGIDIYLEQIPGGIVGYDVTDTDGEFGFDSLVAGIYEVHVDIPGYDTDTMHQVVVTGEEDAWEVEVCIDEDATSINICDVHRPWEAVGMAETNEVDVVIYPNPASDKLNVFTAAGEQVTIKMIDATGRIVHVAQQNGLTTIDVSRFESGVYFLEVSHGTKISRSRVIVQ